MAAHGVSWSSIWTLLVGVTGSELKRDLGDTGSSEENDLRRMDTKPHNRLPAILLCFLIYGLPSGSGLVGKLHGSVELPCVHHKLPGPIEEITVYWQLRKLPKDLVVAAVMNGVVDTTYVDFLFRGRAQLNPDRLQAGNFNLNLTNLSLYDSGTYDCIILWSPSYSTIFNKTTVELEVTAEFSTPVLDIPAPGNLLYGQELTLTCTSQGGLEQPRIMWINTSDGSELQEGHMQQVVHQDEDVINVTSTITLNVTSNIYILCVILTKHGNLTSQHYKMELPQKKTSHVLMVTVITGGLVGVLLTAILVKLRHTRHTPSYEVPINQMPELGRS